MLSNYLFILALAAMWLISFINPSKKKPKKNVLRALQLVRTATVWWVFGMAYRFLGFLLPNRLMPGAIDKLLDYTVALPCRLGEGLESVRVAALGARFDLAYAMLWGLPFAFLCAALVLALQVAINKQVLAPRRAAQV